MVERSTPAGEPAPASTSQILTSVSQIESVVRARGDVLLHGPCLDRDELVQTADELAQLSDYLAQIGVAHSQFLSKVAHELRTPLTIAKGWMSMLGSGALSSDQERIVKVVDEQIDELTRLVNDLLDLSRRETGTLDLRLEILDLAALLEQVVEHQRELASLQGIQLVVAPHEQGIHACVDRGRIAQVLNNLITNACRYVPHYSNGRVVLGITINDSTVHLSVKDNGVGIPPEDLPRVFEPFYQVPGRKRGKSGLGLALTQELVRAHGGSLTVESTPGLGTTFHIWLRRVEQPAEKV